MELYFVRHGIAADQAPDGGGDAARALTEDGIERMRVAARGLRRLGVEPQVLLSSPYTRTRQTAELLASELRQAVQLADPLMPGCSLAALERTFAPFAHLQRIMVVGHEPDFSEMIGDLTGGRVEMKKGAVCRVDFDRLVSGYATLIWMLPPRVLRELGERV